MSDEKKPNYHFTMSGITNADGSENFTVQFNSHEGMSEEEMLVKIDQGKRLFDHVWKKNNVRAVEIADKIKKDMEAKRTNLPERFN